MTGGEHERMYWQYQYDVCARFIVPLLEDWGARAAGASILDVGCGEGGGLCSGFDIDESRIQTAVALQAPRTITFTGGSLYDDNIPFSDRRFDLVMLHDVFEHLDHKPAMIDRLRRYLNPGGKILLTFPPYYSAYGGHQQHLHAWFARLPFFHLLPFSGSFIIPRLGAESPHVVEEVRKLIRLRMGMRKFEQIAAGGRLRVEQMQAYLISPNHIRFGLRPIPAGLFARIPLIREFACTGVIYLLSED